MKKVFKKIANILAFAALFLVGAAGGLFLSLSLFSGFFNPLEVILGVVGILISLYVSIIAHEAGHLIFGLISGYTFSSFRIGSFMWIKQDGKIKIRRLSIAGTGGQCLMTPPEKNEKTPVVLYNLGGVIANIILAAIFACFYYLLFHSVILLALVFLFGAIVSFIIALTNGLPLDVGGIPNDGMNVVHLLGDKVSAVAFKNQLLMNAAQGRGVGLSDMPDEWFVLPDGANMKNVHCASIAVFAVSRNMEKMDFASSEKEIKSLIDSDCNMAQIHRNLLKCDLVYCRLMSDGAGAEISSLLTIEQQKFMKSMKNFPSIIRTEYAIALIRDKNTEMAEKAKQNFENAAKTHPYPQDIEQERRYMEHAENIAQSLAQEAEK